MRTLVVGLGWVAREVWLPRLLAHPKFRVVGAVEPAADAVRLAAGLLGDVPVHADYREVDLDGVDVVFVLTPNRTHGRIGEHFLRRGRTVFLEKPTGTDRGQLDMLAAAVRDGGGRLTLSTAARYRTDVDALARLVADGVFGTPRLAELSWVRGSGIPRGAWFTDRAAAGGGVLVDLGWHVIDVAHHLWDAAPVRTACAMLSADFLAKDGWEAGWQGPAAGADRAADVEDQISGLVATEAYWMRLHFAWASHEETDRTTITLHGTDATAVLRTTFGFSPNRAARPSLTLKRRGEVEEIPLPPTEIGAEYDRQLDALVDLVEAPGVSARALAEAYDVLAVVDACYRAAELA